MKNLTEKETVSVIKKMKTGDEIIIEKAGSEIFKIKTRLEIKKEIISKFASEGGKIGGKIGGKKTGPTKKRGDSEYYRNLAKKSAEARRRKKRS